MATYQPHMWAEDVTVGQAMDVARITPVMLPGHKPGFSEHWIDIDKAESDWVTAHAVKADDMRELYRRENQHATRLVDRVM